MDPARAALHLLSRACPPPAGQLHLSTCSVTRRSWILGSRYRDNNTFSTIHLPALCASRGRRQASTLVRGAVGQSGSTCNCVRVLPGCSCSSTLSYAYDVMGLRRQTRRKLEFVKLHVLYKNATHVHAYEENVHVHAN